MNCGVRRDASSATISLERLEAMRVHLEGRFSEVVDFKKARHEALCGVAKGEKILWEIDFGFFNKVSRPLGDEMQAKAHVLAIEHFAKSLWPEFYAHTTGLSVYKGALELSFKEAFSQYLNYLILNIPDSIPLYLELETRETDLLTQIRLASREGLERFEILLNGVKPPYSQEGAKVGVVIPSQADATPQSTQDLKAIFEELTGTDFRVIIEPYLTAEWDGLDLLYYSSQAMTPSFARKLKGFEAAGGLLRNQ